MRNILIGLTIGLLLNGLIAFASEHIMINKPSQIAYIGDDKEIVKDYIYTTKATTAEGQYRIFILQGYKRGGITAVRIK